MHGVLDGPADVVHDHVRLGEVDRHLRFGLKEGFHAVRDPDVHLRMADHAAQMLSVERWVDPGHQGEVSVLGHCLADQAAHPPGRPEHPDADHRSALPPAS